MRRRPDRLYLLIGAVQGFTFSWALAGVVWWVVDLGLSPLRLVLLGTALELTVLATEIPTGVLADVWSRKWSVCAAYVVMGTAMMLGPVTTFFPALLAWQALLAIGWTLQSGAATAWVADELAGPADSLIVSYAKWRSVGLMAGLPFTAAVGFWSVQAAMVAVGAVSVAFGAYLVVTMTEARPAWRAPGAGGPRVPGAASGAASRLSPLGGRRTRLWPEALRTARAGAQLVRGRWILVAVLMSTVVMGAANEAVDRLDTLRITALGLPAGDTTQAIVFFGVVWFAMSALMLPVITLLGRRIDDMATRRATRLLAVLLATSSVGVLALSLGPWFAFAVGGWAVRDVATEVTFPLAEAVVNRHADSSVRATVISFLGQAESLGQVVGGVVLGVVAQLTTVPWALTAAAALLGVAALPYLVRRDVGV